MNRRPRTAHAFSPRCGTRYSDPHPPMNSEPSKSVFAPCLCRGVGGARVRRRSRASRTGNYRVQMSLRTAASSAVVGDGIPARPASPQVVLRVGNAGVNSRSIAQERPTNNIRGLDAKRKCWRWRTNRHSASTSRRHTCPSSDVPGSVWQCFISSLHPRVRFQATQSRSPATRHRQLDQMLLVEPTVDLQLGGSLAGGHVRPFQVRGTSTPIISPRNHRRLPGSSDARTAIPVGSLRASTS